MMPRMLICAVLVLALCACGGSPSTGRDTPAAGGDSPVTGGGASKTASETAAAGEEQAADLFARREAPPEGVPALLSQSVGGDGFDCREPENSTPAIDIFNEWVSAGLNGNLPGEPWTDEPSDADTAEVGWPVYLNLMNLPDVPGTATLETPSGQKIQAKFEQCVVKFTVFPGGEYRLEGKAGSLDGEPVGLYRATVSAGGVTAKTDFRMRRSQHPRLTNPTEESWPPPSRGETIHAGVVGGAANTRTIVGVYRKTDPDADATTFTFRTVIPVQTDANGEGRFDIDIPANAQAGCYLFALSPADYPIAAEAPIPQHRFQLCLQ